jgi:hypothetical protein
MTVDSTPCLHFSAAISAGAMSIRAKCNAQAASNPLSYVSPAHSISNSFLFLTFAITTLHSIAAEPPFFARIRRLAWPEAPLDGGSTENLSKFALNMAKFGRGDSTTVAVCLSAGVGSHKYREFRHIGFKADKP